jgi:hypothetical protein
MNYNVPGGMYPGKLQTIAILQTVIGALEILGSIIGGIWVLIFGIATFGIGLLLIPIPFVFLIIGILSLVSGIKGLNRNPAYGLTLGVAISQMVLLLACDVVSFGCGLAALIILLQDDVKSYFR